MNVGGAGIVLRERAPLEVLDLSLLFCQERGGKQMLALSGVLILPSWAGLVLMRYVGDVSWAWVWLAALALHTLLELPFVTLAGRLLFEPNLKWNVALGAALGRLPAHLWTQLLIALLYLASSLTLVGPFFVATMFCFVPEILVLEGQTGTAAMRRAQRFLIGRSGTGIATVFLRGALLGVGITMGELLGQAGLSVLLDVHLEVDQLMEDGGSPFALLGLLLTVPLTATFRFLSYVGERTVQDGWDVQVALLALAGEEEPSAA